MNSEHKVSDEDVFKAIGHLDEATEVMKREAERSAQDEEQVVGFFTILGRILKGIFGH